MATAIGAFVLAGVSTTYIMSQRGLAAMANYGRIHSDARIAMEYFARDMRGVTNIISFANSSNITVSIATGFNATGAITNTATVTYSTSGGALSRYDSRTGATDTLASHITQLTFTLYDLAGNTNSVALSNAKGIQCDMKLGMSLGSWNQSEDYLSARYDMRNTAN